MLFYGYSYGWLTRVDLKSASATNLIVSINTKTLGSRPTKAAQIQVENKIRITLSRVNFFLPETSTKTYCKSHLDN